MMLHSLKTLYFGHVDSVGQGGNVSDIGDNIQGAVIKMLVKWLMLSVFPLNQTHKSQLPHNLLMIIQITYSPMRMVVATMLAVLGMVVQWNCGGCYKCSFSLKQ